MRTTGQLGAAACLLVLPTVLLAQTPKMPTSQSDAAYIRTAQAGAQRSISEQARVARIEKDGHITILREGSNDFTCAALPDMGIPAFCGDPRAWEWLVAAMTSKSKPPNGEPGVAYMMQGGTHYETPEGEIVMQPNARTHAVKEPPHWMLMWPVDAAKTGLPTLPNPGGVYVMFAGTPYAHLMVYQNPARLSPAGPLEAREKH